MREFSQGDWVVYRKSKQSPHPGPRAQSVNPSTKGEVYSYVVDKYWVVQEVLPDGRLRLRTRRGKTHVVDPDDPNLRRAGWLDRMLHRGRFLQVTKGDDSAADPLSRSA